eukprot:3141027-Rhodomonas_salina.3
MSGTDIAYGAMSTCAPAPLSPYAMFCINIAYGAASAYARATQCPYQLPMLLRASYAVSGTGVADAVCSYACPIRCPVLTLAMLLRNVRF